MKKNIREYMSNNPTYSQNEQNSANSTPSGEEAIKTKINNYSRMSDGDLMSEMNRLASAGKANGTLDEKALKQFYMQVSPMLTEPQRNKLKQLINSIK